MDVCIFGRFLNNMQCLLKWFRALKYAICLYFAVILENMRMSTREIKIKNYVEEYFMLATTPQNFLVARTLKFAYFFFR